MDIQDIAINNKNYSKYDTWVSTLFCQCPHLEGALEGVLRNDLQAAHRIRFGLFYGFIAMFFEGCLNTGEQEKVRLDQIETLRELGKRYDTVPDLVVIDYEAGMAWCTVRMQLPILGNVWPHSIDTSLLSFLPFH